MAKLLNSVFQAGIVVEDLEAKVKYYAEELGIGPWKIFRTRDADGNVKSMFARGWTGGAMNKGFELSKQFEKVYQRAVAANQKYNLCFERLMRKHLPAGTDSARVRVEFIPCEIVVED